MVTTMGPLFSFFSDLWRILAGRPLLGVPRTRGADEKLGRFTVKRYSRGNVAVQANLFVTKDDLDRELEEVAGTRFRN